METLVRLMSGPLRGVCLTVPLLTDATSFLVAEYPDDMPGYRAVYEYELDPPPWPPERPCPAHWARFVRWEPRAEPTNTPIVTRAG